MHREECITPVPQLEESSSTLQPQSSGGASGGATQQQILPPGDISSILQELDEDDTFVGTVAPGVPNVKIDDGTSDEQQGDQVVVEPPATGLAQVDDTVVHEAVSPEDFTELLDGFRALDEQAETEDSAPDVRPAESDGGADGRRRLLEQVQMAENEQAIKQMEDKNAELVKDIKRMKKQIKENAQSIRRMESENDELKKRKAKEKDEADLGDVAGPSCDDAKTEEPPIKKFKMLADADEQDVVEDEQREDETSDEDAKNFLDAVHGSDRTV